MTRIRTGRLPTPAFPIMWGRRCPSACGLNRAAEAVVDITADIAADIAAEGAASTPPGASGAHCGEMYIL